MSKASAGTFFQAPAATYRSEARFRRLLERLPAGAYTCDADGLITFYNRRAVDLWGRTPKLNDPVDRFCGSFKLFAKDGTSLTHDNCWMALAIRENRGFNGEEVVIERPDGRRVMALAHANPMHDDEGRLIGAVNVLVDVTERSRLEEAVHAADRSKTEFIAAVAHELRNPLAPIRNVVDILHMRGTDGVEDLPWALDVLERQVGQMTRLLDDLLDFARLAAHRLELRREPAEMADVLHAALESSRPAIAKSGHELIVEPAPTLSLVCDRRRIAQAISNLLGYCARHAPRGGRIWVGARRDGDHAVITVRANEGGSDTQAPRVSEPLTPDAPDVAAPELDGMEVSLVLARALVERHGGTLAADSRGGNTGREFVMRLPARPQGAASPSPDRHVPFKILVVDRSRASGAALRGLLQLLGHRVREARDAEHARHLAEALRPDVVLVDLSVPATAGLALGAVLRRQADGHPPRTIGVYENQSDVDLAGLRAAGFDDHLVRPVEATAVLAALARVEKRPDERKSGNGHWHHPEQTQVVPLPLGVR